MAKKAFKKKKGYSRRRGWYKAISKHRDPFAYATQGTIYKFRRSVNYGKIYSSTTQDNAHSYVFTLADLPNYTEFTTLFDQYMITGVKIKLIPTYTENQVGAASTNYIPPIYTLIDYDDNATLNNVDDALQYQNVKMHTGASGKIISRYLKPHIAVAGYSGTFSSYLNKSRQWIDAASATVQHYGFKMIYPQCTGFIVTHDVVATFYLKFRNVR